MYIYESSNASNAYVFFVVLVLEWIQPLPIKNQALDTCSHNKQDQIIGII